MHIYQSNTFTERLSIDIFFSKYSDEKHKHKEPVDTKCNNSIEIQVLKEKRSTYIGFIIDIGIGCDFSNFELSIICHVPTWRKISYLNDDCFIIITNIIMI